MWFGYLLTILSFILYTFQFRHDQSLPIFLGNISYFLVSIIAVYGIVLFHYKRHTLTSVIKELNIKNLSMLRSSNSLRYRLKRNRIHLTCIGLFSIGISLSASSTITILSEFLYTGEDHFKNYFTMNSSRYSLGSIVNCIVNLLLITWVSFYYNFIFTIVLEIFLVIALNYQALAENILSIKIGRDENSSFKRMMVELQDQHR